MGLDKSRCVVVEDSGIGLKSAMAAGIKCIVTKSSYTAGEDFTGADLIVDELGEDPATGVTLKTLAGLIEGETPAPVPAPAASPNTAPSNPATPPFPTPPSAPATPSPAPDASPPASWAQPEYRSAPSRPKRNLDVFFPDWTKGP